VALETATGVSPVASPMVRIEVVFDNPHRTSGLIKRPEVNTSQAPSELQWRTTGFAWDGFSFEALWRAIDGHIEEDLVLRSPVRKKRCKESKATRMVAGRRIAAENG